MTEEDTAAFNDEALDTPEDEKVVDLAPEVYTIEQAEMLSLQLCEARLQTAQAQLQLHTSQLTVFRDKLAGKYSEYGKYQLLGEIDLQTLAGMRILVQTE